MSATGADRPGIGSPWHVMSDEAMRATESAVRAYRVAGADLGAVSEYVAIELHNLENEIRAVLQKR